ncbi:cytidylate kinase [Lachnospiraceae bacterium 2_1_46FAA]|nr:cytidylate kinase [Lachnospiraceae bacterium 2_1_46FAA]
MGYNIAIDGPAGAGKSTIAKKVAKKLGYIYVDTGALYRGMAVYFLENGVSADETEQIGKMCRQAVVTLGYEDGVQQVYLNGENITAKLREEEVGKMASVSSAIKEVRLQLLELQRDLAAKENVVMDGRDIGTNVLPQAETKIYLTASVETRAKRRFLELQEKGVPCVLEEIAKDIEDRDYRDMNRDVAPLKQAEDAVYIDSSEMSIDEVVAEILKYCK